MLTVPVPQSKSTEQGWGCWEGQLQTHGWDKLIPSGQSLQAGTARVSWGGLSCPESLPGLTTALAGRDVVETWEETLGLLNPPLSSCPWVCEPLSQEPRGVTAPRQRW